MKFNPFKRKPALSTEEKVREYLRTNPLAPEDKEAMRFMREMRDGLWNFEPLDATHDWEPVEGYDGIEVLVERPVIVQVRKGPIGSRTHGKYRVPTDVANLDEFVANRVNEFFENRAN